MAAQQEKKQEHIAELLLVAVAIIWGMGFPITQMAIDARLTPGVVVALRFWVSSIALGLMFRRELRTMTLQDVKYGGIAGALLVIAFLLQVTGQNYTTPSNSAFLTSTNVIIVPFLGWIFFRQKPTKKLLFVSIGCLIGATALILKPGEGIHLGLGDTLTMLCAVGFSTHMVYLGRLAGQISVQKLTFMQTFVAAIVATVYMLMTELPTLPQCDFAAGALPILFLGLMNTAFSFFAQTYAQKHASPTKTAIILGTEGLLGSIFSVLLGYESLTANLVVGGAIIFTSLLVMEVDFSALRRRA